MRKRHAGRLHGGEFVRSAVAQGHDGSHQHRQRQRQVDQAGRGEDHQLEHDPQFQALANHVVGVHPKKLHVQNEQSDGQGHRERAKEGAQHETGGPHGPEDTPGKSFTLGVK